MSTGTNPTIAEMVETLDYLLAAFETGITQRDRKTTASLRDIRATLSSLSPLIEAARREAYEDAALTCDNYTSAVDLNASSRFAQSVADELAARIRTLSTFPAPVSPRGE